MNPLRDLQSEYEAVGQRVTAKRAVAVALEHLRAEDRRIVLLELLSEDSGPAKVTNGAAAAQPPKKRQTARVAPQRKATKKPAARGKKSATRGLTGQYTTKLVEHIRSKPAAGVPERALFVYGEENRQNKAKIRSLVSALVARKILKRTEEGLAIV